jgi:formylglycine-generating enzyme required for sulfatase activity
MVTSIARMRLLIALLSVAGAGCCLSGNVFGADATESKAIILERNLNVRFDAGNRWAVVIGINNYLDPTIPDLQFCVSDARLMARTLATRCGYEMRRILLLVDDQEKAHLRPLGINLRMQIADWLKNVRDDDTVVVFYSGHGFLDQQGQGFLAPQDCERNRLELTGFRVSELRDLLHQSPATQKLVILDCCHAGSAKSGDLSGPSSQELSLAFRKAEGLVTLASCRKNERSQEWEDKQQGLFTYFLAEGLGGEADYDKNRIVDSDEIYRYTVDKVPSVAQLELNGRQTPVRIIGEDVVGVFALARSTALPPKSSLPSVLTNSIGQKFVLVKPGSFLMGSPTGEGHANEHPQHRVEIESQFYISETEVTQAEYEQVMGKNPSWFSVDGRGRDALRATNPSLPPDTAQHPVEMVSYEDAAEFCRRLTQHEKARHGHYRLPTEAEWEYAAKGGSTNSFDAVSSADALEEHAWILTNSQRHTWPVRLKSKNGLGLFDMAGNVWEWCSDWYDEEFYQRSSGPNPAGPIGPPNAETPQKVLRGGGWIASAESCRPADRNAASPEDRLNCYGIRLILEP